MEMGETALWWAGFKRAKNEKREMGWCLFENINFKGSEMTEKAILVLHFNCKKRVILSFGMWCDYAPTLRGFGRGSWSPRT